MSDLLPCPFCGGEASAEGVTTYNKHHQAWWEDGTQVLRAYFVNCIKCGVTNQGLLGGRQTRVEAIAAWNTRQQQGGGK